METMFRLSGFLKCGDLGLSLHFSLCSHTMQTTELGFFFSFFLFFPFSVVVALAGLELTEGPTASASLVLEIKV